MVVPPYVTKGRSKTRLLQRATTYHPILNVNGEISFSSNREKVSLLAIQQHTGMVPYHTLHQSIAPAPPPTHYSTTIYGGKDYKQQAVTGRFTVGDHHGVGRHGDAIVH